MPQPQFSDFSDFLPSKEKRAPLPITNLPVNALSDEIDPTREIRTLIDQLQQAAKDARTQARAIEVERDEMADRLGQAALQIEQLRANEREFRAQFVEISALLRERDEAIQTAELQARAVSEAERRLEVLSREREDAQRQREEANCQREEANRQRDEANRQREETGKQRDEAAKAAQESASHISEVQRQIVSIRQARDAAQAVNLELNARFATVEDELADTAYGRETAEAAANKAQEEITSLRRQLEQVTQDRDATAKQVFELTDEVDSQNEKVRVLTEQKGAVEGEQIEAIRESRVQIEALVAQRDSDHSKTAAQEEEIQALLGQLELQYAAQITNAEAFALASTETEELRRTLESLTVERDAERAKAETKEAEIKALIEEFGVERAAFAANSEAVSIAASEAEEMRQAFEALSAEREASSTRESELAQEMAIQQESLTSLTQQLLLAEQAREEALGSLATAHDQIEQISQEREGLEAEHGESMIGLEAQVAALQMQVGEMERLRDILSKKTEAEERKHGDHGELARRFEKQRMESIELGSRLDADQRQILELTANLAEARLQVKFATSRTPRPRPSKVVEADPDSSEILGDAEYGGSELGEPLTDREAKSNLAAMRRCFSAFAKDSSDLSQLNELYSHLHGFSDRARVSGMVAIHRLSSAFAELAQELYKFPEMVNPSSMRTVHQTIEFLTTMLKEKQAVQFLDPAKAMIYVVDDDLENCRAIAMAMETVMVKTTFSQEPAVALGELASGRYDLIFLDVNLPGMDGFELCAHIRELAIHTTTPIVFLTGMATLENRVQSSLSGGNEFVSKPFNLHELSVKALTLILKAQLQLQ